MQNLEHKVSDIMKNATVNINGENVITGSNDVTISINQNGTSIVITNDDWDDKNENSTAIAQHYKLPVKYGIIDASGKKTQMT